MKWCGGGALKLCVLGDPGVGKTSLVRRLAEGTFDERCIATVGARASTVTVGGKAPGFSREWLQKLALWDVTGRAGPETLEAFLRGARAALVVADATRLDTQLDMWKWVEKARKAAGNLPIILVISKSDLVGADFDTGPVAELSRKYAIPYRMASARTGQNVQSVFTDTASRLVRPWAAIESGGGRPRPGRTMRRPAGRFDRWDLSAGFRPGGPGPSGWPDTHGSCVVGSAGRARG